ncbi:MAG: protein translocase subunit SecD [bacterium]|jgi:preprotein translocase subunit SecD
MTRLQSRTLIIVAVLLVAVYGIIGLPKSGEAIQKNLAENIRLGLDLKGGSYFILQVQVQDAIRTEADRTIEQLKEELRKAGIVYTDISRNDPQTVEAADSIQIDIRGVDSARSGDVRTIVSGLSDWNLTAVNSTDYRMTMKPSALITLKRDTVERTRKTIATRIDSLGLVEPVVQQVGNAEEDHEILVQLPGVDDPARVKQIMQAAAMLEISEVRGGPYTSPEDARAQNGGVLPLNTKLVREALRPGQEGQTWWLVSRTPVITGTDLRSARPGRDSETGRWETDFRLSPDGARRFERFTGANVGKRLAIILDNQVRSAPVVESRISDSGRITGARDQQDASDLALVLESGALPAGVTYSTESTVGPSLGADSIRQGITAGLVGLALIVIAMVIYYNKAGINAVIALMLNAVLTVAVLAYFGAVWTLPGIAGLILSIGMSVDSNVLIFERIREELRAGKGVVAAVEAGFDRAFITILDTHVVTVVSSAFLFMFGTGPVKGFAVTLVVGLIANLFTAVFVSRTIFDWTLSRQRQPLKLSI